MGKQTRRLPSTFYLKVEVLEDRNCPSAGLPSGYVESTIALLGDNSLPTDMAIAPDGRAFVAQKYGQLRVIEDGALLPNPFVSVTPNGTGERGLLGVTLDPAFSTNGYVYVYYTVATSPIHNRVSRFTADPSNLNVALAGSETILLSLDPVTSIYHNAGGIKFGLDGKLYISVGEDTVSTNAQTLSNRLGKVLRINSDGTIPNDNPFYATAAGENRAIWAYGLRNPFKIAVHPGTGRLFINDVGFEAWEEINDGLAGANYGWPQYEGFSSPTNPIFVDPVLVYGHGNGDTLGRAITGGAFYAPASPNFASQYIDRYFFSDYVNGWIHTYDSVSGTNASFASNIPNLVDLEVGADGSLYYLTIVDAEYGDGRGAVRKIRYTGIQSPSIGQQPVSPTISEGQTATLIVRASGDGPLTYRWQRNESDIPGATQSVYITPVTTLLDDGAVFRCVITNSFGEVVSSSVALTVNPNQAPTPTINSPGVGSRYRAGDTINFAGMGIDPEDGTLPTSSFTWQIDFHHGTHVHPGAMPPTSGISNGSFTIPTVGETAADVWYRVYLSVQDSAGVIVSTYRDVHPYTSIITLITNPPGLQITLDGQPQATSYSTVGVEGLVRTIGVSRTQSVNGIVYEFLSWSDGGASTHEIATPTNDTTYVAVFEATSLEASFISAVPTDWQPSQMKTYTINVTNTGTNTWNAAGPNEVRLGVHFGTTSDWPHDGWSTDQRFYLAHNVAPGETISVNVTVVAPVIIGSYVLRHRMLKENVAWFSQIQKANVTVALAALSAAYDSIPPNIWAANQSQSYTITMTNTGAQAWNAGGTQTVRLGVHFGTASDGPHDGWVTDQRFYLPADVAPGASLTMTVNITAPTTGGNYVLRHRMVKENFAWFNEIQKTNVTLDGTPPQVTSLNPTDSATGIPDTINVSAIFSEAMNPATLTASNVYLTRQAGGAPTPGGLSYDPSNFTVTLTPSLPLQSSTAYIVTIKGGAAGVTDLAGNPLAVDKTWSFTTLPLTTAIVGAPANSPEGTPLSLTSSVAGANGTVAYAWLVTKNSNIYATGTNATFVFTPNDNGAYVVSLTVTDSFANTASDTKSITVANVAPAATIMGAPANSPEGTAISMTSSVNDPGTLDTFIYAWNVTKNGAAFATGTSAGIAFTPNDNAIYVLSLVVTDKDGGVSPPASTTISATNVVPTVAGISATSAVRGQNRAFVLTASDPSNADQAAGFIYTINWGDGSSVQTVPISVGNGAGVTVNHRYTQIGTYTVQLTATDKDGGAKLISTAVTVSAAALQTDPIDSSKTALVVGGTTVSDTITLSPADTLGNINVVIGGISQGIFRPTGRIFVYGQAGVDTIRLAMSSIGGGTVPIAAPAMLFGEDGNDTIDATGSTASSILIGGNGNDTLTAGSGGSLLLGGAGSDILRGGAGDDILIGCTTSYDVDLIALATVMAEWTRTDANYNTRINHLNGTATGGLNGAYLLNATSVQNDNAADDLTGGAGLDWFFSLQSGANKDRVRDKASNETITAL